MPYLVTINASVFTDVVHKDNHTFGSSVYDSVNIYSFTFSAIMDDSMDNGTLQYMNTDIAGAWEGPMQKSSFLTCMCAILSADYIINLL